MQSKFQDYLGETGHRITERTADHSGKDKHSYLFEHACNENHKHIKLLILVAINYLIKYITINHRGNMIETDIYLVCKKNYFNIRKTVL